MASLGSFGRAVEVAPEPDTFEFFGRAFRVDPEFGELQVTDFFEKHADEEESTVAGMLLTKQALRMAVHPDDFQEFWETAQGNHQGTNDLIAIYYAILTAVIERDAERPTELPSDSTDGLGPTQVPSVSPPADPAMDTLSGRPDLQLAFSRSRAAVSA